MKAVVKGNFRRYFVCDCGHRWDIVCRHDDPDPDCPKCKVYVGAPDDETAQAHADAQVQKMVEEGKGPGVLTHKSRAIDYAQKVAEEDYGLTNMRDNAREGENHIVPERPISAIEAQEQAREIMQAVSQSPEMPTPAAIQAAGWDKDPSKAFWSGSGSLQGAPGPVGGGAPNISAAAPAAAAARQQGFDPVEKLHKAGQQGLLPIKHNVVGRAKMPAESGA